MIASIVFGPLLQSLKIRSFLDAQTAEAATQDQQRQESAMQRSLLSQGDRSMVAIPVFPNRTFRHSAIYVRRESELTDPAQLAGKRVGVPEWAQTAGIYARGSLMHQYGLQLSAIEWWQAGVNQPGRTEKVELRLPQGVRLHRAPEKTLSGMLASGELDAAITAHPPEPFERGDPSIVRLFRDGERAAQEVSVRLRVEHDGARQHRRQLLGDRRLADAEGAVDPDDERLRAGRQGATSSCPRRG